MSNSIQMLCFWRKPFAMLSVRISPLRQSFIPHIQWLRLQAQKQIEFSFLYFFPFQHLCVLNWLRADGSWKSMAFCEWNVPRMASDLLVEQAKGLSYATWAFVAVKTCALHVFLYLRFLSNENIDYVFIPYSNISIAS